MSTRKFIQELRHDEIVAAIRAAEQKTSGEIRIFISHKHTKDAVVTAQAAFERLGMTKTRHRNAVLIFVAPQARKFAVIGDQAVHQRCGDQFWQELAGEMSGHFKRSEFMAGILHAIRKAGALLAEHFPPAAGGSAKESSDEVTED